jgi:hypothetical protein
MRRGAPLGARADRRLRLQFTAHTTTQPSSIEEEGSQRETAASVNVDRSSRQREAAANPHGIQSRGRYFPSGAMIGRASFHL